MEHRSTRCLKGKNDASTARYSAEWYNTNKTTPRRSVEPRSVRALSIPLRFPRISRWPVLLQSAERDAWRRKAVPNSKDTP